MAKKRIDRKFDTATGIMSFTELASNESLACDASKLFPFYGMSVAETIAHLSTLDGDSPLFGEVQRRGIGHFLNAKVGDSAADPEKPTMEQLGNTWDTLLGPSGNGSDGAWSSRGDGTGAGGRISDVVTAIFNLSVQAGKEVTEQAVADWYTGLSDDEKKDWRNRAAVQVEVQNIRDTRAKARKKALTAKAKDAGELVLPEFAA